MIHLERNPVSLKLPLETAKTFAEKSTAKGRRNNNFPSGAKILGQNDPANIFTGFLGVSPWDFHQKVGNPEIRIWSKPDTSWWFQPIWKILVKMEIFPK